LKRSTVRTIGGQRLNRWLCRLVDQHAMPFALVGIGHDDHSGEVTICACEDVSDADLLSVMRGVVRLLEERTGAQ